MPTVRQLLKVAVAKLREQGVDTPLLDAEMLMCHTLGCARTDLLCSLDTTQLPPTSEIFLDNVNRRAKREPLSYITGRREFYGLSFQVSPATLIPRQETEFLVDVAVNLMKDHSAPLIADIGVGTGCVAIAIAHALPSAQVYGTDVSRDALEVARSNAAALGVGDRARFVQGDLFSQLVNFAFDMIVSNPPYIPHGDMNGLQQEVAEYEPRLALDGGQDGLDIFRRLARSAPEHLRHGGVLAVEMGVDQSSAVQNILRVNGFSGIRTIKDYAGIERVAIGEAL